MVTLTAILDGEAYQIKQQDNGRSALAGLIGRDLDLLMAEAFGSEVAGQIRRFSGVPILLITPDENSLRFESVPMDANQSGSQEFGLENFLAGFDTTPRTT